MSLHDSLQSIIFFYTLPDAQPTLSSHNQYEMCAYVRKCFEVSWMLSCRLKDLHVVIKTTCRKHRDAWMRFQHIYLSNTDQQCERSTINSAFWETANSQ